MGQQRLIPEAKDYFAHPEQYKMILDQDAAKTKKALAAAKILRHQIAMEKDDRDADIIEGQQESDDDDVPGDEEPPIKIIDAA